MRSIIGKSSSTQLECRVSSSSVIGMIWNLRAPSGRPMLLSRMSRRCKLLTWMLFRVQISNWASRIDGTIHQRLRDLHLGGQSYFQPVTIQDCTCLPYNYHEPLCDTQASEGLLRRDCRYVVLPCFMLFLHLETLLLYEKARSCPDISPFRIHDIYS